MLFRSVDLKSDIKTEKEKLELLKIKTTTLKEKLSFFKKYFSVDDDPNMECYPELCGEITGILARDKKFQEALEFLGINNPNAMEICWDS